MRRRGCAITRQRRNHRFVFLAAIAGLAAACDFVTPPGKSSVASLAVVNGGGQTGTVGAPLPAPIAVRALDKAGRPLPGQSIAFSVAAGGGSVDSATVTTDDSGVAATRWTLGTSAADSQALDAQSTGSNPVSVTITAAAQPGGPAALKKAAGDNQNAAPGDAVPDSLEVKVVDQYGNPVPNASVSWATTSGSISPSQDATNAQGIASAAWVLGTDAGASFSATASHNGVTPVTFSAGTSLNGTTLTKVSGDAQSGPVNQALAQPLVVTLRSPGGAPISGATVHWTPGSDGGSVQPSSGTTDANGTAQATWTMPGSTGQKTLTADVSGQASATFTATATAGAAASIRIVAGNGQSGVVGSQLPESLAVALKDAAGNPVVGATISWAIVAGGNGGIMTPAQSLTNADGVATTYWSLGLRADTTHGATAILSGLPPVLFTATPQLPPVLALARIAGDSQAGQVSTALAESLVVMVKLPSPDNRPVQGVKMTWSASGGGTVAAGTARTQADGTDRAKWTLGPNAGIQTATVRWLNAQNQPVDSTTFTATAGFAPPTSPPALSVSAPVNWTVARPSVGVNESCAFGGRPCNVAVYVGDSLAARASGQLNQSISLAPFDGGSVVVALCAEDPTGAVQSSCTGRTIVVESSTQLNEVATVPGGQILDANGKDAVFVSDTVTALGGTFCSNRACQPGAPRSLVVEGLSGGGAQAVSASASSWARVTPAGAVFWKDGSGNTIEWVGGQSTNLGAIGTPDVAGGYAAWVVPGTATIELRSSAAGTTSLVSQSGSGPSVTASGDVWFAGNAANGQPLASWQIFHWSGGTAAQVTNDSLHNDVAPKTDGTNAAFLEKDVSDGGQQLAVDAGGTISQVTDSAATTYAMSNGWVFFYRHTSTSPDQLWARSSSGSVAQVTMFGTPSTAEAYGNSGQVIYTNNGRRYKAVPGYTSPPTDIGAAHGQRVENVGGNLYVALGRSLFQVK